MSEPVDLNFKRVVRNGERAWKEMLASNPELRRETDQRMVAVEKLRIGMQAMLDCYSDKRNREAAELAACGEEPKSEELKEMSRVSARDDLLAEIANLDNPPLHTKMPGNELSEIAFWVLSEALETIAIDNRTYKKDHSDV